MGRVQDALRCLAEALRAERGAPDVDAAAWEEVALPWPDGAARPYLDVLRGSPDGDVWLLATASLPGRGEQRFAFHDLGGGFARVDGAPGRLLSVSPLGRTDAWFARAGGALAHHDGAAWTSRVFEGCYHDFLDLHARDGRDIWIAATGARAIHFDGAGFRVDAAPVFLGSSTHELWGAGEDLIVPVNAPGQPTRVARRRGGAWVAEELGAGGATLVHGSGPDDVWVLSRRHGGWHHDGRGWTRHPMSEGPFWALHVAAPDRAYAVGDRGALATWDGARWQTTTVGRDRLVSVWRQRDGRLLIGGTRLYRSRAPR